MRWESVLLHTVLQSRLDRPVTWKWTTNECPRHTDTKLRKGRWQNKTRETSISSKWKKWALVRKPIVLAKLYIILSGFFWLGNQMKAVSCNAKETGSKLCLLHLPLVRERTHTRITTAAWDIWMASARREKKRPRQDLAESGAQFALRLKIYIYIYNIYIYIYILV